MTVREQNVVVDFYDSEFLVVSTFIRTLSSTPLARERSKGEESVRGVAEEKGKSPNDKQFLDNINFDFFSKINYFRSYNK